MPIKKSKKTKAKAPRKTQDRKQKSSAEARRRELFREVALKPCKDKRRRDRLEKDPEKWLKYYMAESFPLEFGEVHREIITRGVYAIKSGGRLATAAPRGTGKSTVSWGLAIYALVTNLSRFVACVAWSTKDTKRALRFWKNALCFNERLAEDYPEFMTPFRECGGNSQRLLALIWKKTKKGTGAKLSISDGLIIFPDGRGVIGAATLNGNPRGLNHTTETGVVLRPEFVLIDDPQDRETAESPTRVRGAVKMVETDVLGMAGPNKKAPCMMSCTVIARNDAADYFLSSDEWDSIRVPRITSFPRRMKLWEKWNKVRIEGIENKDEGAGALAFYLEHKNELNQGASVSWEERYDKERGQPDALYSAMEDYFIMGKAAFFAEHQNDPQEEDVGIYNLEPAHISTSIAPLPMYRVPDEARVLVGFADINRTGLAWAVCAFDQVMSCHVCVYGVYPGNGTDVWEENAPELDRKQKLFGALTQLCRRVGEMPFTRQGKRVGLGAFLIDRGYEADVVQRIASQGGFKFRVFPSRGYAAHKYTVHKGTLVGRPMEECHVAETRIGQFLAHNADHWREIQQRAWLGAPGSPGSATLFESDPRQHTRFADEISAERLKQKYNTDRGMRWEWAIAPGRNNDLGDAVTGCYVAAAWAGLSSSGTPTEKKRRRKETRKAKVGAAA